MQNAIVMGPPKSFITQIIASHVKLNQLIVTFLKGIEPQSKWTLPIAIKDCLQKNIDNILVLHKKHTNCQQGQNFSAYIEPPNKSKNTKTINISKCTKVQKPKNAKLWQE